MTSATQLLTTLQRHIGKGNGVSVKALALTLDTTPRHVRSLVTELREEGIGVCAHPKYGYFIAATAEELEETCVFLHTRGMQSITLASTMRKCAGTELNGQRKLES